jgi:putative transposase
VDNSTEFTSKALGHWACWNRVRLDLSRPWNPTDNPFIESFNVDLGEGAYRNIGLST